jgi:hypothetical protein
MPNTFHITHQKFGSQRGNYWSREMAEGIRQSAKGSPETRNPDTALPIIYEAVGFSRSERTKLPAARNVGKIWDGGRSLGLICEAGGFLLLGFIWRQRDVGTWSLPVKQKPQYEMHRKCRKSSLRQPLTPPLDFC